MSNKLYSLLDTHDALVLDGLSEDDITGLYESAYFQAFEEEAYNTWFTDDRLNNDLDSNYYRINLDNSESTYYDDSEENYIDCSVYITTIGKYVEKIIITCADGTQKVCSFTQDTFTDDNLIDLLQQLQSDNNVTAYNVQYW